MPKNPLDISSTPTPLPDEKGIDQKIAYLKGLRGERSRHLEERLKALHQRELVIEQELRRLEDDRFYRVCIFGSARIKPESSSYNEVVTLASILSGEGIDILTGGGPGLMEAANKGALEGKIKKRSKSRSYGISIELDFEPVPNLHLDVKRHHHKFSSRLDDFMRLSHSVIVTPGGIGTLLELFFSWQLIQVKHLSPRPIVLLGGEFWTGLLDWMKASPLGKGLVSGGDFDYLKVVTTPEEASRIILDHFEEIRATSKVIKREVKQDG
jgi:uncharacterized protein (TIGR00730 family)